MTDAMKRVRVQFRTVLKILVVVYVSTFCVLLPIFCWNQPFSRYYLESSRTLDNAIAADVEEGRNADEYFAGLDPAKSMTFYTHTQSKASELRFAIGIITVRRTPSLEHGGYRPRYLARVVAEFDRLLKRHQRRDVVMFVCNAQWAPHQHVQANRLAAYVRVVSKNRAEQRPLPAADPREQEKRDYEFCMGQAEAIGAQYSILVQDDALPLQQFVTSMDRVVDKRLETRLRRGEQEANPDDWVAAKFYFPEKWQGYGFEGFLIVELVSTALLGGGALYAICTLALDWRPDWLRTLIVFALLCTLAGLAAFAVGRPNLLNLRLFSSELYSVRGAPECCIPAVLYRTSSMPNLRQHLRGITCSRDNPLDIAISRYFQARGQVQYLIMPNLFNHIGIFSSLHSDANSPHLFRG